MISRKGAKAQRIGIECEIILLWRLCVFARGSFLERAGLDLPLVQIPMLRKGELDSLLALTSS